MITNIKSTISVSTIKDSFPTYSKEEMEKMLKELVVRFNTSPKLYEKQDFGHLVKCITGLYTFQGADISKVEELLKNNGRLVNSRQIPNSFCAGYSVLQSNRVITFKKADDLTDFYSYVLAEGDSFLVMDTMELYCYVDGQLKLTGSFSLNKSWEELI